MTEANWSAFYHELSRLGPLMLGGVHPEFEEYIRMEATATDSFYSDSLQSILDEYWNDNPEEAVKEAYKEWVLNVKRYLDEILGPWSALPEVAKEVTGEDITYLRAFVEDIYEKPNDKILDQLATVTLLGMGDNPSIANLLVQGIIERVEPHSEGYLIRAISLPWKVIARELVNDWNKAFKIPSDKWEEMIAAAFEQDGFDQVILTPRSGDRGRDVIAIKNGIGSIRIIDSVKAYKPGHLVKHDDIRALSGVMHGDHQATKAILTTTSDFAPGIITDPYLKPLIPYRLELMNGEKLRRWLESLATC